MIENAYAQALLRAVQSGKTPKAAVSALHESLVRRGRTSLMPRIGKAFARIAAKDGRRNAIVLTVAGDHATHAKKEAKDLLASMHIDADTVEVRKDESLIGGWRLEGREVLHDASFKKHLLSIYNRITQ